MDSVRQTLGNIVDSTPAQRFIVVVLLVNAATLGLETSPAMMERYGVILLKLNETIPYIFVVEVGMRLIARGPRFFREGWNVFDVLIISISFMPSGQAFAALRALRVLRVLHVISLVPRMRYVIASLVRSLPQIGGIVALLVIINYITSVITTHLFGADFDELFGGVGASMLTLFQLMTLEGWAAEVVRPVMEKYPYSIFLFIPYMLMTAFAILNLFTAVLVDSMQVMQQTYTIERTEQEFSQIVAQELVTVKRDLNGLIEKVESLGGNAVAADMQALSTEIKNLQYELEKMRNPG